MIVHLKENELEELLGVDVASANKGGFQNFLVQLGHRVDSTGELELSEEDMQRLDNYANNYGDGGFQNRIFKIFGRELAPQRGWKRR